SFVTNADESAAGSASATAAASTAVIPESPRCTRNTIPAHRASEVLLREHLLDRHDRHGLGLHVQLERTDDLVLFEHVRRRRRVVVHGRELVRDQLLA